jgi:hypothetical protein
MKPEGLDGEFDHEGLYGEFHHVPTAIYIPIDTLK